MHEIAGLVSEGFEHGQCEKNCFEVYQRITKVLEADSDYCVDECLFIKYKFERLD